MEFILRKSRRSFKPSSRDILSTRTLSSSFLILSDSLYQKHTQDVRSERSVPENSREAIGGNNFLWSRCTWGRGRWNVLKMEEMKSASQYGLVSVRAWALLCAGVSRLSHRIKSYHSQRSIRADTHVPNARLDSVSGLFLLASLL